MKLHPEDSRNMILEFLRISDRDDEKIEMTEFQFDYQIKKVYQHYYYPGIPYMIEEKEEVIHQIGSAPLKYTKINRIELIK